MDVHYYSNRRYRHLPAKEIVAWLAQQQAGTPVSRPLETGKDRHVMGAPSYSASALDIMDDSEMYSISSLSVTSTPCMTPQALC